MSKQIQAKSSNVVCKAIVFAVNHVQFRYSAWLEKSVINPNKTALTYAYRVCIMSCLMSCEKKQDMGHVNLYAKILHCN